MEIRRSKDEQGFQVSTSHEHDHVVTFRMERDDESGDRVVFAGTFNGTTTEWGEIVARVSDIELGYSEGRRGK